MPKIVIVLAVAFAVLGGAAPALARPGVSAAGPADQARYARCFTDTLATVHAEAVRLPDRAARDRQLVGAGAVADAACQPQPANPKLPLTQSFRVPPGLAGTAIVSCDSQHQFSYHGTGFPYRAADPTITGDTGIVTGGPYPYTASAQPTGPVGGYHDAFYWRINNTGGGPATLVMSVTCQRPAGF